MEKVIRIDNKGFEIGCVGWLLKEADHIKVALTKDQAGLGAWLKNESDETIVMLACQNYNFRLGYTDPDGSIYTCDRNDLYSFGLSFEISDACWEKIEELSDIAKGIIEDTIANDPTDKKIKFIIE